MRAADNPFRMSRLDALDYRAPGFDWPALLERLDALGGRGFVRGACGSGKSTLLRGLERRLRERGLRVRRLRPDPDDRRRAARQLGRFVAAVDGETALLLDGWDRLGLRARRRLGRAAARAACSVHTTHRQRGRATLHRCATTPRLLEELIAELDGSGSWGGGVEPLFRRHRGNLRTALRECYARAAKEGLR